MRLIYKGKYNGDPASIPHREHKEGAVEIHGISDMKKLGVIMNVISLIITFLAGCIFSIRAGVENLDLMGAVIACIALFPHELLHAVGFKEEVYLYSNLSNGLVFVTGPEDMSKGRAIVVNLLPNIVLGLLPFVIFLIKPDWAILGSMGVFAIGMGAGDYYNIYNLVRQMPKGARTYMYQDTSYWYMPD